MNSIEEIGMLMALNMGGVNVKKLIASLLGNGSVIVICSFLGVAILAAIIIFWRKKKKGNKGRKDDE